MGTEDILLTSLPDLLATNDMDATGDACRVSIEKTSLYKSKVSVRERLSGLAHIPMYI